MSECNLNTLRPSSKGWMVGLLLIFLAGGGVAGGFIASYLTEEDVLGGYTDIYITVSEDFTLAIEAIEPLEVTDHDCALLIPGGQFFENSFFDATMEWLEEDDSRIFDEDTILDDLGLDEAQMGLHVEFISDEMMSWGASEECSLNGKSFLVSFGKNTVLFYISVGVYVESVLEIYDFTFEGSNEFVEAIYCEIADYEAFSNAGFVRGQNTLVINGMTIVDEGILLEVETCLDVTFNGEDILMPLSNFAFP